MNVRDGYSQNEKSIFAQYNMQKKPISTYNLRQQNYFFQRQIKELLSGGLPVLFRKCGILSALPFALLVVLLVRLLRPYILIRFIPLTSSRIGHFANEIEIYLCKCDTEYREGQRSWDIFYCVPPICNQQLRKMWKRTLTIFDFAYWFDKVNRKIPGGSMHTGSMPSYRDMQNLFEITPAHLSFSPKEEYLGQEALHKIGIPEGAPFVCFFARDSAYLDAIAPDYNWSYHNYRDTTTQNYIPAAEALTQRGYLAIRMGAIVKDKINTGNPRVIDYATNSRNDFLDIFLSAKCRFFISSGAGLDAVSMVFRKPIVWTNFIPLEYIHTWGSNYLTIPKKLWLRQEKRLLRFKEILDSGVGRFLYSEEYEKFGIEVVENTPEEIISVVIEMDERIKGAWRTSDEDEQLQQRFWSLFKLSHLHGKIKSRIGTEFLRQNHDLLE